MEKSKRLEKFLTLISDEKSGWLEKMKMRQVNKMPANKFDKIILKTQN